MRVPYSARKSVVKLLFINWLITFNGPLFIVHFFRCEGREGTIFVLKKSDVTPHRVEEE